jgi:LysR family nitrogen assimilation transcriptional regulator
VSDAADRSQFDFVEVFQEELFVAAAADFLPFGLCAGDQATIPLERVSELPLVMPSMKHNARKVAERIARASQITLNVVSELDSYSQIVETVDRASAYSLMSRAAALAPVERGSIVLIPISSRPFKRSCYHIRKRQRPVTSASLAVEAKAVAIIREMNDRFALNLAFA